MRTTTRVAAGLLAGATAIAAMNVANAQEAFFGQDEAAIPADEVTSADQELLDALLDVEADRPPFVPEDVTSEDDVADATIDAPFGESRIAFDAIEGQLLTLFIDGEDAGTTTGLAVSAVANGLLLEREAVQVLEEADDLDAARDVDSSDERDENGLAIDADDPTGTTLVGVDLLLQARVRQLLGYTQLVDIDPVFADRFETTLDYVLEVDPLLRRAVGLPDDQLVVTLDRFDAPVGEARATAASYLCVDRTTYQALTAGGATPEEAAAIAFNAADTVCEDSVGREADVTP